ncbi:hypothetical protein [Nocardia yamanashiensis]|uniref:hypothetical protein n=1 Tax=Nocardia yamanashiensis TaxID=209247 RepID=UPI00082E6F54|nr:hypothetical protein [Nocardia yamanashiensis]
MGVVLTKACGKLATAVGTEARGLAGWFTKYRGVIVAGGRGHKLLDGEHATSIRFAGHQVTSTPLIASDHGLTADQHGKVFGVFYPSGLANGRPEEWRLAEWARMPERLADKHVVPVRRITPTDGTSPHWEPAGPPEPAPWAHDAPEGVIYVVAPANPEGGFYLDVNTPGGAKTAKVDAPTLASHTLRDENFRAARTALPDSPIVLLSGGSRSDGEQFAAALHRSGVQHDIYVPNRRAVAILDEHKSTGGNEYQSAAEIGLEALPGRSLASAVDLYRAPAVLPD